MNNDINWNEEEEYMVSDYYENLMVDMALEEDLRGGEQFEPRGTISMEKGNATHRTSRVSQKDR